MDDKKIKNIISSILLSSIILINGCQMKRNFVPKDYTKKNTKEAVNLFERGTFYIHYKKTTITDYYTEERKDKIDDYILCLENYYDSVEYDIKSFLVGSKILGNYTNIPANNGFYRTDENGNLIAYIMAQDGIVPEGYTLTTLHYAKVIAEKHDYYISKQKEIDGYENLGEYTLNEKDSIFLIEYTSEDGKTRKDYASLERISTDNTITSIVRVADLKGYDGNSCEIEYIEEDSTRTKSK